VVLLVHRWDHYGYRGDRTIDGGGDIVAHYTDNPLPACTDCGEPVAYGLETLGGYAFHKQCLERVMRELDLALDPQDDPNDSRPVRILAGAWKGRIGFVLDRIPHTNWYNVLVIDSQGKSIRLALEPNEFEVE